MKRPLYLFALLLSFYLILVDLEWPQKLKDELIGSLQVKAKNLNCRGVAISVIHDGDIIFKARLGIDHTLCKPLP